MAESTTDYKKFKFLMGNRRLDKNHVQRLGESMAKHPDLFQYRPVLVNKNFELIDGQHRYQAAKQLKIPVWYEIAPDLSTDEAQIINQNQNNWKLIDYARSHAAQGNEHYKKFLKGVEEHPMVPLYTIIRYLAGNALGGKKSPEFKAGKFEARTYDVGMVYLEMLEELIEINRRFGLSTPSEAMFKVFQIEGYDHDRMISKLASVMPESVQLYGTIENVLRNLEDIYNWKQRNDILRFYGRTVA